MDTPAPEYVAARTVLLDALAAIDAHRDAVVLVGAQAVYLHAHDSNLTLALMTTDSDLVVRASLLEDNPDLADAFKRADFTPGSNPGSWLGRGDVVVDLMVAPHESNVTKKNARAADLKGHAKSVARITAGLEPALVDHAPHLIAALDGSDPRRFLLEVAGPAALVSAKLVKLAERYEAAQAGKTDRTRSKDVLDIFRLLQKVPLSEFIDGFKRHSGDEHAARVSRSALSFLQEHGVDQTRFLPQLLAQELIGEGWAPPAFAALAEDVVRAAQPGLA